MFYFFKLAFLLLTTCLWWANGLWLIAFRFWLTIWAVTLRLFVITNRLWFAVWISRLWLAVWIPRFWLLPLVPFILWSVRIVTVTFFLRWLLYSWGIFFPVGSRALFKLETLRLDGGCVGRSSLVRSCGGKS